MFIPPIVSSVFVFALFFSMWEVNNLIFLARKGISPPVLTETLVAVSWGIFFYLLH